MEEGRCHLTEQVPDTSGMLLRSEMHKRRSNLGCTLALCGVTHVPTRRVLGTIVSLSPTQKCLTECLHLPCQSLFDCVGSFQRSGFVSTIVLKFGLADFILHVQERELLERMPFAVCKINAACPGSLFSLAFPLMMLAHIHINMLWIGIKTVCSRCLVSPWSQPWLSACVFWHSHQ